MLPGCIGNAHRLAFTFAETDLHTELAAEFDPEGVVVAVDVGDQETADVSDGQTDLGEPGDKGDPALLDAQPESTTTTPSGPGIT